MFNVKVDVGERGQHEGQGQVVPAAVPAAAATGARHTCACAEGQTIDVIGQRL